MARKKAVRKKAKKTKEEKCEMTPEFKELKEEVEKLRKEVFYSKEELKSEIAMSILNIYFSEVANRSLKKEVTLAELVNAYKFTLEQLEGSFKPVEEEENEERPKEAVLRELKQAVEKTPEKKPFSCTNVAGERYYLHSKGNFYYFSKNPEGAVSMPEGYFVEEDSKTSVPVLRKKDRQLKAD